MEFFRFRKTDLRRIYNCFQIPAHVTFSNRSTMCGEEAFLRFLYYFANGEDQYNMSTNIFGREQSEQSQAWTYMVSHFYRFNFLLHERLQWFEERGFLQESTDAIAAKLSEVTENGLVYEQEPEICGFIDCNCLETTRVGGGPRTDGPQAERFNILVQRAFYNGWKSVHGLKHQTFDTAHGLTVDICGPTSLRRNDLKLLGDSDLNNRLRAVNLHHKRTAFGDSIYVFLSNIRTYWPFGREHENRAMKKLRVSIEWNYMSTAMLFQLLQSWQKLRILDGENVRRLYIIGTILRNCHVILYGCQTSSYFNLVMPDHILEAYVNGTME